MVQFKKFTVGDDWVPKKLGNFRTKRAEVFGFFFHQKMFMLMWGSRQQLRFGIGQNTCTRSAISKWIGSFSAMK